MSWTLTAPRLQLVLEWPTRRMSLDERAELGLAALRVVSPVAGSTEWIPLERDRPVVDVGDASAFTTYRALTARRRSPHLVSDPDDGFGGDTTLSLGSSPNRRSRVGLVIGRDDPPAGFDKLNVQHWLEQLYEDPDLMVEEFRQLIAAVPCQRAFVVPHGDTLAGDPRPWALNWGSLRPEVRDDVPRGWMMWFADEYGQDLSAIPGAMYDVTAYQGGRLLKTYAGPTELTREDQLAAIRALEAGEPAAARQ